MVPSNSITHIRPTTLGWSSTGAKSVAKARPTVWVVCKPAPTSKNATAAPIWPTQAGAWLAWPEPDSTNRANGITARPPNCSKVPIQM